MPLGEIPDVVWPPLLLSVPNEAPEVFPVVLNSPLFSPVKYGEVVRIASGLEATFYDAGHVFGSSMIKLTKKGYILLPIHCGCMIVLIKKTWFLVFFTFA